MECSKIGATIPLKCNVSGSIRSTQFWLFWHGCTPSIHFGGYFLGFFPGLDDGPISRLTIAYGRVEGYRYGTPHAPQGFFKTLSLDIFVSIALPRMSGRSQNISNVPDSWILLERAYCTPSGGGPRNFWNLEPLDLKKKLKSSFG